MMGIVFGIILGIVIVAVSFSLSSVIVLFKDYKYYKTVYKKLPTYTFYKFSDQVWNNQFNKPDFIWFTSDNHFCLVPGHYLHNAPYTWTDPYAAYWLIKYRRWFKKNCRPIILDFKNN